eukprot:g6.t1
MSTVPSRVLASRAESGEAIDVDALETWSLAFGKKLDTFAENVLDKRVRVQLGEGADVDKIVLLKDVFPDGATGSGVKPEWLPLLRVAAGATYLKRKSALKALCIKAPLGCLPDGTAPETAKEFVNEFVPLIWAKLKGKGRMKQLRARLHALSVGKSTKETDASGGAAKATEDTDDEDIPFVAGDSVMIKTLVLRGGAQDLKKIAWKCAKFVGCAPIVDLNPIGDNIRCVPELNKMIVLWRGNITRLKCDAIQNAANRGLNRGGGICGAIFKAAGPKLEGACKSISYEDDDGVSTTATESSETAEKVAETTTTANADKGESTDENRTRCPLGSTCVTEGFDLPAKHILHSVGPSDGKNGDALASAYTSALDESISRKFASVALCCLSTGIFGFPNERAAHIAISTVRRWLETHVLDSDKTACSIRRVVFCAFDEKDYALYAKLLPHYFPEEGTAGH